MIVYTRLYAADHDASFLTGQCVYITASAVLYVQYVAYIQSGPKKLRQIFLAITLVNMDRF